MIKTLKFCTQGCKCIAIFLQINANFLWLCDVGFQMPLLKKTPFNKVSRLAAVCVQYVEITKIMSKHFPINKKSPLLRHKNA